MTESTKSTGSKTPLKALSSGLPGMERPDKRAPPRKNRPHVEVAEAAAADGDTATSSHSHGVSFAVAQAGAGSLLYAATLLVICNWEGLGDPELERQYHQVDAIVYQWPMLAFATAFFLNFILLLYERGSSKFQLAIMACYINGLACTNDFLSWKQQLPIVRDAWGQGMHLGRHVMWLFATISMVYVLSIISDFSTKKVYTVMIQDALMIISAILSGLVQDKALAVVFSALSFLAFGCVLQGLWGMFTDALREAQDPVSRLSLHVLRVLTVVVWSLFPNVFLVVKAGWVDVRTEEVMWTIGDLMGKIMFSTSLLQGNFLTIEQRRRLAMRAVEEANRVQVIQELRELVEQKEHFISGMSHELRTPLNGIIGLSEAILAGSCGAVNEPITKAISTIKTSGGRLLALICDILDAAAMRELKSKFTVRHERVVLPRIVQDVMDLSTPLVRKGVRLVNHVPTGLPPALGDSARIIQILHNLVGNACKFTHEGAITLSAAVKGELLEVSVTDTGIGIPQDKFSTIFQAFQQVDMSTTRKYGGTGLGLNLVSQLVEAHGGTISVKSKPGVGTRFSFTLQLWQGPDPADAPVPDTKPGAARPPASLFAQQRPRPSGPGDTRPDSTNCDSLDMPSYSLAPAGGSSDRPSEASGLAAPGAPPATAGVKESPRRQAAAAPEAKDESTEFVPAQGARARPLIMPSTDHRVGGSGFVSAGSTAGPGRGEEGRPSAASRLHPVVSARTAPVRPSGAPPVVLSVDDDPVNQMVMQSLLGPAGYQVVQAMDGQEALDYLTHATPTTLPDLILLDVMMPGMSGHQVCSTVRDRYPDWGVPIIMVSARSKEEDIVEGLMCGANDYVVKPFGRIEILARIAAHLRSSYWVASHKHGTGAAARDHAPLQRLSADVDEVALLLPAGRATSAALTPYLNVRATSRTLPEGFSSAAAAGADTLHELPRVTLVVWRLANPQKLWAGRAATDLAAALAAFHMAADAVSKQCGLSLIESPTDFCCMAVCGLHGEGSQAHKAMDFAAALCEAAAQQGHAGDGAPPLQLCAAVHVGATHGVVVGMSRPVLHVTGQLLQVAGQLLRAAQPGTVHVSEQVFLALDPAQRLRLASAGALNGESTYLLKSGAWQSAVPTVAAACIRLTEDTMANLPHSHGPMRLSPLQRALIDLVVSSPAAVLQIGSDLPDATIPSRRSTASGWGHAGGGPAEGVDGAPAAGGGSKPTSSAALPAPAAAGSPSALPSWPAAVALEGGALSPLLGTPKQGDTGRAPDPFKTEQVSPRGALA